MIASTQTNHPLAALSASMSRNQRLDEACSRLKDSGLRVTQPRVAILKELISQTGPVSIEQIHQNLSDAACDLVTVYRCLAAFENIGLVRRSFFHNGTSLYQLERAGAHDYHVINKADHTIEPLPMELAGQLAETIAKIEDSLRERGYADVAHSVEFFTSARPQSTDASPAESRALNVEVPGAN